MQRLVIPGMVLLGLVLVVLGSQWNRLRPATSYWGDKQAAEYSEAQVALHTQSHEHVKNGDATNSPAFVAAKERFDKIKAELEGARSSRSRTGNLLIAAGLISVISAVVLHFRGNSGSG
jgi:hypothetical protein